MKPKTIGTLLIVGLVVLSAMVVFATPVVADDPPPPDPPEEAPEITPDMLNDRTPYVEECDDDPTIYGYITDESGGVQCHVEVWKWQLWYFDWDAWKWVWHWTLKGEGDTDSTGYYTISWWGIRLGWYSLVIDGTSVGVQWISLPEWKEDGTRWDYQWDHYIPEFATIAIPAASVLGLFLYFNKRKQRKE